MSSIKGIRNLTGLLLKLVPHRKLNGRQVQLPQILCQIHLSTGEKYEFLMWYLWKPYSPLELI